MEPTPSRRDVLRVGSLAAVGLVGGLSGCQGRTSAASDGNPARIDTIPDGVTAATHIDVDGLLNDQQLRVSLDSFARDAAGDAEQTTNVSEALESANDRLGLDSRDVSELVAFGAPGSPVAYVGLRLWTDWSESTVTEQLGSDSQQRTYGDVTVYDRPGDSSLAVLGDGQYVAGTTAAVEDALDVRSDDASAVSGEVRTAFTAAQSGYVRLGFDVPAGLLSVGSGTDDPIATAAKHVEYGYGSVTSSESGTGATLTFEATDKDGAETLEDQLDGTLTAARGQIDAATDQEALRDRVVDLLDETEVVRDSGTVTVRNEDSGGELVVLVLGAWLGGFALGVGQNRTGSSTANRSSSRATVSRSAQHPTTRRS